MQLAFRVSPTIGVARVGNSKTSFYYAPETLGGLPSEADGTPVTQFKENGQVRRQAVRFRVYASVDGGVPVELTLAGGNGFAVTKMEWQVHVANKKAAWYNFSELEGNELIANNSYAVRNVELRNSGVTGTEARRQLIIDPGPRTLSGANQRAEFDKASAGGYKYVSFPETTPATQGTPVKTLGQAMTDGEGRLSVLGGYGHAAGDEPITGFGGANTWHDDICDGYVRCHITGTYTNASQQKVSFDAILSAWLVVGSPKFAPELVNIVTMDDVMFDIAVREMNLLPELYAGGKYNPGYVANYERDILPILERPGPYRWVANTPSMNSFSPPPFDTRDNGDAAKELRQAYFAFFRAPGENGFTGGQTSQLFAANSGMPMMPLNSGSNSVTPSGGASPRPPVEKFVTLTRTQYFLLGQWAAGKFTTEKAKPLPGVDDLDRSTMGNCVGGPLCPGIEMTWSMYSPSFYAAPWQIKLYKDPDYYWNHGLDPSRNEAGGPGSYKPADPASGAEPGDLTKRMAIPWQSDFFQCTIQYVNFTVPDVNKTDGVPLPPTYYAYWWPPQSPWNVIPGDNDPEVQALAGIPAALQSIYSRGINSFSEMITGWSYLGFINNVTTGKHRSMFPNFVEQERNHDRFIAASVAVAGAENVITGADANFFNTWYMKPAQQGEGAQQASLLMAVRDGGRSDRADDYRPLRHPPRPRGGVRGR